MTARETIFDVLDGGEAHPAASRAYSVAMVTAIVLSLLPLLVKDAPAWAVLLEQATTAVFIVDYVLRWATADKLLKKGASSFARYPFTFYALIDLLSILPSIVAMNPAWKLLKILRAARVLRVFRLLRYSRNFQRIVGVLRETKGSLLAVAWFAMAYVLISALLVFNVEPDTFDTFFDAVYWAVVSLTTVGYGDIYPTSTIGRVVTMLSSVFGIAVVALPAGVVTAGFMGKVDNSGDEQ